MVFAVAHVPLLPLVAASGPTHELVDAGLRLKFLELS